jgi:hypothetical protein
MGSREDVFVSRRCVRASHVIGSAAVIASLLFAAHAGADVKLDGEWPDGDATVSLELSGVSRAEALRELAREAGWSLVLRESADDRVDLVVKNEPATKVLDALLDDGEWVAKRSGSLVTVSRAGGSAAAVPGAPDLPPPPPPPLAPGAKERDVEVFGNNLRIGKDDVVRDVTVMGGNVDIEGRVTGDLAVVGGTARLLKGSHIQGDASVTGGLMKVEEGARIDGDLGVVGGSIEGAQNAKVGGSVKLDPAETGSRSTFASRAVHKVSEAIRTAAFFFVIGALAIALGGARAETLRAEIAARPMRSAAVGLLGLIGSVLAIAVAAVTVIGLPVAMVGALAFIIAIFVGVTSALTVLGAAVSRHKTPNVYVHLAVGCLLFLVVGLIPIVGGLLQAGLIFAGFGGVVATRAAGLFKKRGSSAESAGLPYR